MGLRLTIKYYGILAFGYNQYLGLNLEFLRLNNSFHLMKLSDKTTINDGGYISFWFKLADEIPDKSNCVPGSSGCSGIYEKYIIK